MELPKVLVRGVGVYSYSISDRIEGITFDVVLGFRFISFISSCQQDYFGTILISVVNACEIAGSKENGLGVKGLVTRVFMVVNYGNF